ncbi:MAG TPA: DUF6704 family protein [Streptosporangiaceae bacterium]|nr:DUF6704 family protein [Streptosporangiaceae bacterium]
MSSQSTGTSRHGAAPGEKYPHERPTGGHKNLHGRPASWVLVAIITAAFIAGGFAVVFRMWPLFWVCAGVVLLSVPAGKVVGIMGDTVLYGSPAEQSGQAGHVAEDTGSAADPGVDVGTPRANAVEGG